jgi:UDP-N-acetylglucosamine 2-epimerase (non-hydrolysing)
MKMLFFFGTRPEAIKLAPLIKRVGRPFENMCYALQTIAQDNNIEIIYPVQLNPNVRKPVFNILKNMSNIHLIEPMEYPSFV